MNPAIGTSASTMTSPAYDPYLWTSLWRHRHLIDRLARAEISHRYRSSLLGFAWTLLTPLVVLAVYTFVFGVIVPVKWPTPVEHPANFAMVLFAGLLVFNFFSECFVRAPRLLLENPAYVTQVVFPVEILAWVAIATAAFNTLVGVAILSLARLLLTGTFPWLVFLLPLVFAPLALFTAGVMWMVSSLGLFLRDLGHVVALLNTAVLFLCPIFYPLSAVPEHLRPLIVLNPLTWPVEQVRRLLIWDHPVGLANFALFTLATVLVAELGLRWFRRCRPGFADAL